MYIQLPYDHKLDGTVPHGYCKWFVYFTADYNNNYNDYGDNVAYGKYDFTNDYLNKYHGMTLINGGFTYGGKGNVYFSLLSNKTH